MWALNLGEGLGLKIIIWNYQQLDSICSPGTMRNVGREQAWEGEGANLSPGFFNIYKWIKGKARQTEKHLCFLGKENQSLRGKC